MTMTTEQRQAKRDFFISGHIATMERVERMVLAGLVTEQEGIRMVDASGRFARRMVSAVEHMD
jgi:hypothetical protein